jgi:FAD/FMN-containing dehydrogenase
MASTLEEFRGAFDGEALLPGDAGYDEARDVWNGDIDRRPALIARCGTPIHVAQAIALARTDGLELTVRGGGHNFAGSAVCDRGVMIDLSPMADVTVDAPARRARCGGGATWAGLDGAAQQHGLAVTGGFISHTGVGGLTLGGGMGWLTRKAARSCARQPTSTRTSSGLSAAAAGTSAWSRSSSSSCTRSGRSRSSASSSGAPTTASRR